MRLSILLTVVFLGLASLVGVMGYLFDRTGSAVLTDVESVQATALEEVSGATEMLLALQASQVAAQELLAERYRARVEPDHESEWGSAGDIDRGDVYASLERFSEALDGAWSASRRASARSSRADPDGLQDGERRDAALREISGSFAVYRSLVERFVHLARYHPSDQVREFIEDDLRPHYRKQMLVPIRAYQKEASDRLRADVGDVQAAIGSANVRNRWIVLIALAAATVLGLALARSITGPIGRLAGAVRAFGQGEDPGAIAVGANNEVGELAAAFRQMMIDLEARTISLREKDVLLKEIHHRVKNNLQIVSSLLRLQEGQESDPRTRRGLRDSQNRVLAMALIHEHLYRADDLGEIVFSDFVRELVDRVSQSHGAHGALVEVQVAEATLGLDQAIPWGMIINELVSNALQHAVPAGATRVSVAVAEEDQGLELSVADDGPGLPTGFDPATLDSLGLKLVAELAQQLGGELAWSSEGGAVLRVRCLGEVHQEGSEA